jgi:uncharacterized protein (TIGR03435 family)
MQMPVLDATGLEGRYQVTLDLPLPGAPVAAMALEPPGPSVQSELKRLGLRLEPRNAPLAVLVVDHAERVPTEN